MASPIFIPFYGQTQSEKKKLLQKYAQRKFIDNFFLAVVFREIFVLLKIDDRIPFKK